MKKRLQFGCGGSRIKGHSRDRQNGEVERQIFKKNVKKSVDNALPSCYTIKAVAESGARRRGIEGDEKPEEHLENYIVQETKNKPVISRQRRRKALKLRNEETQRI